MEQGDLKAKLAKVRLAVFDVDGVLTDGGVYLGESEELKRFDIQDGLGLKLLMRAEVEVGLLTARSSKAVERRAAELGIRHLFQGEKDKLAKLQSLAVNLGVESGEVLYMGDDLADLKCLLWAGVSAAPSNAATEVRQRVECLTRRGGGEGAVREIAERVVRAKGRWNELMKDYLS